MSEHHLLGYSILYTITPAAYLLPTQAEMRTHAFEQAPRNTHLLCLNIVSRDSCVHKMVTISVYK